MTLIDRIYTSRLKLLNEGYHPTHIRMSGDTIDLLARELVEWAYIHGGQWKKRPRWPETIYNLKIIRNENLPLGSHSISASEESYETQQHR